MTVSLVNAQSVLLVVDNDYSTEEATNFQTAVSNTSYVVTVIDRNTTPVTPADMSGKDIVIWHTGGDGVNIHFWANEGGLVPNDTIMGYIEAGGIFWLDGSEYLYDFYTNDYPAGQDYFEEYTAGSFMYDYMGIKKYVSESHANADGDGVAQIDKSSSNVITTQDPIKWKWSTQWNADGYEIVPGAVALYEFGPSSYVYAGDVNCLYNVHNDVTFITTASRTGYMGDGTQFVQADINLFVSEILDAAADGNLIASVNEVSNNSVNIYPNPASEYITINNDNNAQVKISDISGRTVISQNIEGNTTINVNNLSTGVYNVSVISNEGVSSQKLIIK